MTIEQLHGLIRDLGAKGRLGEAEHLCRQILLHAPDEGRTLELLASILNESAIHHALAGHLEIAARNLDEALRLNPADASIHNNLAALRIRQSHFDDAITALERAIELKPDYFDALLNLGQANLESQRFEASIRAYSLAISAASTQPKGEIRNSTALATFMLANAYRAIGRLDPAIANYKRAIELRPAWPEAVSALLYALNLSDQSSSCEVFEEHVTRARTLEPIPRNRPPLHRKQDRLRIGFVSHDLRRHAINSFFPAALNLDRKQFEIFAYASVAAPDEITAERKRDAENWRDISALPDEDAATRIQRDGIDVLIDLNGHTAGNRLPLFIRRPAPVQMSWLGYPNTTGLQCIDYRITDSSADPIGMTERLHTETLVRIDPCFLCFVPSPEAPLVAEPPCRRNNYTTFGSFNDFSKLQPTTIRLWAAVLQQARDSRLMLKTKQFASEWARQQIIAAFETAGVSSDRLIFAARDASYPAHLQRYAQVDIALDTYPYHGTTTTCDAFWMGVPVVTLAGATHVSRVGVSLLHAVSLQSLVAESADAFAQIASGLAADRSRLQSIRSSLRDRMSTGALCDQSAFAQRLGTALLQAAAKRPAVTNSPV